MKPDRRFLGQPKSFWACVRSLGQNIGYSRQGSIIVPDYREMAQAFQSLGLDPAKIIQNGKPTTLANLLRNYFSYRSTVLVEHSEPRLMDVERARKTFKFLYRKLKPQCPIPLNKQRGKKKTEAYLTAIINMLVEANSRGYACDYNPRQLTTITRDGAPLRTMARRIDGAFPSTINPVAVWEIKEYYHTTTFGSRVADGVYETLLDGMELEELSQYENIPVKHYLMVDAHYTWWECGKAYLCRLVDMLHMGYVDEVLFGYEVVEELPRIVREWTALLQVRILSNQVADNE